ncbi:ArnT family glycosyltransferase [Algoriphagus sediminis]|nr:phospholipid carrier-dependent glycosyltransferase [Algoriphagus sediminis]
MESVYLWGMSQSELNINPWVVMAAFLALIGPFALDFHMHYPDEMYYSDAALKMLQNGDYLTTYLGSGELRFKKPILSYWAVLAGYQIFGITPLASRFFFWLAGAATIGLAYAAAKVALNDKKIAGLTALIVASHPILIFSATRSIPDILLAMTMTMAGVGFAGYFRYGNQAPKKFSWLIYLGLALAFEVKGLPAVALGGLGFLFLLFNPWQRIKITKLINIPAILLSLVLACFWFVAMYQIHGSDYLDSFLYDQVGTRVGSRVGLIFSNGLIATLLMVVVFIPWFLFGFKGLKGTFKNLSKEEKATLGFIAIWVIGILGMSALTSKFYERYLLPVIPMAAIGLAWILIKNGFLKNLKGQKWALGFFLILNLIILIFGLYLNSNLGGSLFIWAQMGTALVALIYLSQLFIQGKKLPKAIAYSILLLFFGASISTYQISLPEQGQQAKEFVKSENVSTNDKIGFIGNLHVSSKIRIGLGKEYSFIDLPRFEFREAIPDYNRLIVEDRYLDSADFSGFDKKKLSTNWNSRAIPELLMNVSNPEFQEILEENGKVYYFLQRIN